MRQHQLKLSPVSDSASIPIQEANPKQRKSWLNSWENYLLPFKDQSACAEKATEVPWQLSGWKKAIFWPQRVSTWTRGNKCLCLAGNKIPFPSSPSLRQHVCRNSLPRKEQRSQKLTKKTHVSCNMKFWVISTTYNAPTCSHRVFEGEKVWMWGLVHGKLLQCRADEPLVSCSTEK